MSASPLIQKIKKSGSVLYAFSSAISQEDLVANDEDIKFVFSKFACLKLPSIKQPINKLNNIQFLTIDGQIFDGLSAYNSINLIQSLQNYALNLETILLNRDNYDISTLQTVSERVFFKWLKELGAIRFREAYENESVSSRYVEEDESLTGDILYNRVVQYVGDVDIVNNVQYKGINYKEVYVNIPSEVGSTPVILFSSLSDNNYQPDMILTGPAETLYDRGISTIHPDNLSIYAYYDYDTNVNYANSTNANWANQDPIYGSVNSYFTEPSTFTIANNVDIVKKSIDYPGADPFSDVVYVRNTLDGITIDFNSGSYTDIVEDGRINSLQEYNSNSRSKNFEFNTILLYYDIYRESSPEQRFTNLYGVLFLDNMVEEVDESYIPSYKKYKFNSFINQNGNSYGLKINLRNSQSINNSNSETIINDYNTFSMGLFTDTMIQLQNSVLYFQEQNRQLLDISSRLSYLEGISYSTPTIENLQAQITELNNKIDNQMLAFENSNILLNMISDINDKYNQLIGNKTPLEILYNTDMIYAGKGISINKDVRNKIILNNENQTYKIALVKDKNGVVINNDNIYDVEEESPELYIYLKDYSNYVKIFNVNNGDLLEPLKIFIVDNVGTFENGQVIRIVFANNIIPNAHNIVLYSDYYNKFGYGVNKKIIANIDYNDLSNKPIIDLICIDKDTYTFDYNIVR